MITGAEVDLTKGVAMTDQESRETELPVPDVETRRQNFAVYDGHTGPGNDNPEGLAWLVEQ